MVCNIKFQFSFNLFQSKVMGRIKRAKWILNQAFFDFFVNFFMGIVDFAVGKGGGRGGRTRTGDLLNPIQTR